MAARRVFRWERERLFKRTADYIKRLGGLFIKRKGRFVLVLAGGSTPAELYRIMSREYPFFERTLIFPTDERFVPAEDTRSNYRMMRETLGEKAQIYRVRTEQEPVAACKVFNAELVKAGVPDLVLLGLGEDGHTASLFPKSTCKRCGKLACVSTDPKGLTRISVTLDYLTSSCKAIFLVVGDKKREALKRLLGNEDIPASRVRAKKGVIVFTDLLL